MPLLRNGGSIPPPQLRVYPLRVAVLRLLTGAARAERTVFETPKGAEVAPRVRLPRPLPLALRHGLRSTVPPGCPGLPPGTKYYDTLFLDRGPSVPAGPGGQRCSLC